MGLVTLNVGRGCATGIDPSLIDPDGEIQEAVGVVYSASDPAARKMPGRTVFNSAALGGPSSVNDVLFMSAGSDRLLAQVVSTVYTGVPTTGVFSSLWTLPGPDLILDSALISDRGYVVSGRQSGAVAPFGAFAVRNTTAFRMGLAAVITAPVCTLIAGNLTGSYIYWTTEFDSVNSVESAYADDTGGAGMSPAGQGVRVNQPTPRNASANRWRIYRTIASGQKPEGWLVADLPIATTSFDDTGTGSSTTDALIVLNDPYRIVTINGISESMDVDPQDLGISSICSFEGSLVGTVSDGDLAYTPAGEPHSWPASYRVIFPTTMSGRSTCVRKCGDGVYGATALELFRVNYLADETDNVFSTDVAVEQVAAFGTPSPTGMCTFHAWGGAPVLFVASLQGPMLVAGKESDRAVMNMDWPNTVLLSQLLFCKAVDEPVNYRVVLYFRDNATDSTSWKALHFYYDSERTRQKSGPLPEMAWTGPHPVPGPGTYGASNNTPTFWTAGRAANGLVYKEGQGTVDLAHLTDGSGTIPFRLRTRRVYPFTFDGQGTASQLYVHESTGTDQDLDVTVTTYQENGHQTVYDNITIDGDANGLATVELNAHFASFDVRIVADGTQGLCPINSISMRVDDQALYQKTEIVNG